MYVGTSIKTLLPITEKWKMWREIHFIQCVFLKHPYEREKKSIIRFTFRALHPALIIDWRYEHIFIKLLLSFQYSFFFRSPSPFTMWNCGLWWMVCHKSDVFHIYFVFVSKCISFALIFLYCAVCKILYTNT